MLIPLQKRYLILPNSLIAEVLPMPSLVDTRQPNDFLLGQYPWQTQSIPILDIETLIDKRPTAHQHAKKLCVLYSITEHSLEAYAIPCYGALQLIHLSPNAIDISQEVAEVTDYIHCHVFIGNQIAIIPNLDNIEKIITNNSQ